MTAHVLRLQVAGMSPWPVTNYVYGSEALSTPPEDGERRMKGSRPFIVASGDTLEIVFTSTIVDPERAYSISGVTADVCPLPAGYALGPDEPSRRLPADLHNRANGTTSAFGSGPALSLRSDAGTLTVPDGPDGVAVPRAMWTSATSTRPHEHPVDVTVAEDGAIPLAANGTVLVSVSWSLVTDVDEALRQANDHGAARLARARLLSEQPGARDRARTDPTLAEYLALLD